MKTISFFSIILTVGLIACQSKKEDSMAQLDKLHVELNETALSAIADSIDYMSLPRLTMAEYRRLQLDKIEGLRDYDTTYISMGRVLLANDSGQIITIQVITGGEISEFLLSYDKDGHLQDNLLVAYEDMVEYYSQVSSQIKAGEVIVQTVNFTYDDNDMEDNDKSDTSVVKYQITPEFRFIAD
ncbi:MAG: hypothetical protein QM660_08340 [Dysgonomonas sp.]